MRSSININFNDELMTEWRKYRDEAKASISSLIRHVMLHSDWTDRDKRQVTFSIPVEVWNDTDLLEQHMKVAVASLLIQREDDNWRERTQRWQYNRHQNQKRKKAELAKQQAANTVQENPQPSSEDGVSHPLTD